MLDCDISSTDALEKPESCTKPSLCSTYPVQHGSVLEVSNAYFLLDISYITDYTTGAAPGIDLRLQGCTFS